MKQRCEEQDTSGDGPPDVVTHFQDGARIRQEQDTDADGRPDTVLFFEQDREVRQERDTNADGQVDTRIEYDSAGRSAREEIGYQKCEPDTGSE